MDKINALRRMMFLFLFVSLIYSCNKDELKLDTAVEDDITVVTVYYEKGNDKGAIIYTGNGEKKVFRNGKKFQTTEEVAPDPIEDVTEDLEADNVEVIPDTEWDDETAITETTPEETNPDETTPETNPGDVGGELKAFPTAYGGGAYVTGGRGGNVYHVTNLNDSGTGSLRWALAQARPATVVFDVAGTINLTSLLTISGNDLTIAGQTAPEGGITITSSNQSRFKMQKCNNIIIRYIRVRPFESGADAFELYSSSGVGSNIIFDHMSVSYGGDECFSIRGNETKNITIQRSLIAEGKTGSLFGDTDSEHYSYDNSFLNNLFWNISHRTPNVASDGRVDVINNVVQNWQYRLTFADGDVKLNHMNNYYAMGKRTNFGGGSQIQLNAVNSSRNAQIYTAGNIADKGMFTDPNADNKALWVEFESGQQTKYAPASEFVDTQYPLIGAPLPVKSAEEAYRDVITNVGANASLNANGTVTYHTDVNDSDYLKVMAAGEGAYEDYKMYSDVRSWFGEQRYANFIGSVSSTPVSSRPSDYDSDNDGMADAWEVAKFGDLSRDGKGDLDGDGYTDLEEFLNLVDL